MSSNKVNDEIPQMTTGKMRKKGWVNAGGGSLNRFYITETGREALNNK